MCSSSSLGTPRATRLVDRWDTVKVVPCLAGGLGVVALWALWLRCLLRRSTAEDAEWHLSVAQNATGALATT